MVEAESKEEAAEKAKNMMRCSNCGSWNTDHEYVYVNEEPVYFQFICDDCNATFGKHIRKGQ